MIVPQHMEALAVANRVRLARAALKHEIADGTTTVASVVETVPECAESMTVSDLLMSQHRWGRSRTRRFLLSIPMLETKTLGSMTERQSKEFVDRLAGTMGRALVIESPTGVLHLQAASAYMIACGKTRRPSWTDRASAAWLDRGAPRCPQCMQVATRGRWEIADA